jgi:type III secretion protein J
MTHTTARHSAFRALLVALVFLTLAGCGGKVDLLSGLSEADANETLAVLLDAGISTEKITRKDGISVKIPESQVAQALALLNSKGLPRRHHDRMGDVFKKENLISTPLEERARYLYALSQELEHTFSQIDGVLSARVHIVLPERLTPGDPLLPSSAAVFIRHVQQIDLGVLEPRIRRMVANSIPGLNSGKTDQITVVFVPAMTDQAASSMERVGSFVVEKSSVQNLRITLWTMGLAIGVLIIGILAMALMSRSQNEPTRGKSGLLSLRDKLLGAASGKRR